MTEMLQKFDVIVIGAGAAGLMCAAQAAARGRSVLIVDHANKAGKKILTVPTGAKVLPPVLVRSIENDMIVVTGSGGYMLVTPLVEFPLMGKGKGIKIINIPTAKLKASEEKVNHLQIIQADESITLICGKKHKTMKPNEIQQYNAERGRRGLKLPRGYQSVDRLLVSDRKQK